jgi:hypothetical protein
MKRPDEASEDAVQQAAERRFERLPGLINADPDLVRRGRFLNADVLVGIGTTPYYLAFRDGQLTGFERGPRLMRSWRFAIRAEAQAWQRLWEPEPAAGFHDLFALTKRGLAVIEGDLQPLMANLQYLKDVLAAPRRTPEEG